MKKIVKQVFKYWLRGTDWSCEAKITSELLRGARTNFWAMKIFAFWQKRPTRLFSLLQNGILESQKYFSFLDQEIQRLPIALTWNRYRPEQLKTLHCLALAAQEAHLVELIKNYHLPRQAVVVPLIVHSSHADLPEVIFAEVSHLEDMKSLRANPLPRHFLNLAYVYFARRYPGKKLPKLGLLHFFCSDLNLIGNSFQLAFVVALWRFFHDFDHFSPLCCSGSVDFNTGVIGPVTDLGLKSKGAIEAGCELILACREDVDQENSPADKVFGFSDLESLFHWLLLNSGSVAVKAEIHSWLAGTLARPCEKSFTRFFAGACEDDFSWLADWRKLTLNQSLKQRMDKLAGLIRKRNVFLHSLPAKKKLAGFAKIAALPVILAAKLKSQPVAAENEYLRFREKFFCAQAEIHLASRIARKFYSVDFLSGPDFLLIRKRFPLLIWLFIREPVEFLQFFSGFDLLLKNELELLDFLVSQLECHAREYVAVSSSNRVDVEIMHRAMKLVFPEADFSMAHNRLPMRKRIVFLYQAEQNYSKKKADNQIFVRATIICQKLLDLHFARLSQVSGILESDLQNPILKPLNRLKRNVLCGHAGLLKKKKHNSNLDLLSFNQPGLRIAGALVENDRKFKLATLLNLFSKRISLEPAGEFMTYCLAHFYGFFCPETKVVLSRKFALSRLLGSMQSNRPGSREEGLHLLNSSAEMFRPGPEMLLLTFLPKDCLLNLRSFFASSIHHRARYEEEKRQKTRSVMLFIAAFLYEQYGFFEYKSLWETWCGQKDEFEKSPALVRKTVQALMPVYYLLTGHEEKAYKAMNAQFNCLNRPQFLFEYFRCFVLKGSVYNSCGWNTRFEQEIFSSLVLYKLSCNSIFEMQQYLLHEVQDPDNAEFALKLSGVFSYTKAH